MTRLAIGDKTSLFALPDSAGRVWKLAELQAEAMVVLAFFKVSCPTCQFTFPFLERMFRAHPEHRTNFFGVSQDDEATAREFAAELGLTFPLLIDTRDYSVSNLYALTNVPTIFLIEGHQTVSLVHTGFDRKGLEDLNSRLAAASGQAPAPVFLPNEIVPNYKPG